MFGNHRVGAGEASDFGTRLSANTKIDFASLLDEAVMESSEAHQSQMMQYLNSKELQAGFLSAGDEVRYFDREDCM